MPSNEAKIQAGLFGLKGTIFSQFVNKTHCSRQFFRACKATGNRFLLSSSTQLI